MTRFLWLLMIVVVASGCDLRTILPTKSKPVTSTPPAAVPANPTPSAVPGGVQPAAPVSAVPAGNASGNWLHQAGVAGAAPVTIEGPGYSVKIPNHWSAHRFDVQGKTLVTLTRPADDAARSKDIEIHTQFDPVGDVDYYIQTEADRQKLGGDLIEDEMVTISGRPARRYVSSMTLPEGVKKTWQVLCAVDGQKLFRLKVRDDEAVIDPILRELDDLAATVTLK